MRAGSIRKMNRTNDAIFMLKKCIVLEPTYVPAHFELFTLHQGIPAGQILWQAIQANPNDMETRIKFGQWLMDNG